MKQNETTQKVLCNWSDNNDHVCEHDQIEQMYRIFFLSLSLFLLANKIGHHHNHHHDGDETDLEI